MGHNGPKLYVVLMSAGAAPSLHDARRAAGAVAHLDAGIVLVYGSVALGTANEDSDIDLCLVFDDLGDYSQRHSLKNTAEDAVEQATGMAANVRVCDRPEWRALCGCVSSFERHIASYAVVLCERPPRHVDWDKQLPAPVTSVELAERMLSNVFLPLIQLSGELKSCGRAHAEHAQQTGAVSPADDETGIHQRLRRYRAELCVRALAVIEISLIAVNHSLPGFHLPKLALDVTGAIEAMPLHDAERAAFQVAVGGLDPHDVALWRKVCWGDEDLIEERSVLELATPEHAREMAQAALYVADAAAAIIEQRIGQTDASKRILTTSPRRRDALGSFRASLQPPDPSPSTP